MASVCIKPARSVGTLAARKVRRRRLTEDGNLEISGRELREVPEAHGETRIALT